MGLVLYDSSDTIPGSDTCSGDHNHSHDDDGNCIDITDYPNQKRTPSSHSAHPHPHSLNRHAPSPKQSLPSSRRTHGPHTNKHLPAQQGSYSSADTPRQRRRGRGQGSPALPGSARAPSAPFVPPALMRQDAFCAGSLAELHQLGVLNGTVLGPNQSAYRQEVAYVDMVVYELEDGSTQGLTDSAYASQVPQDGYHDKGGNRQ